MRTLPRGRAVAKRRFVAGVPPSSLGPLRGRVPLHDDADRKGYADEQEDDPHSPNDPIESLGIHLLMKMRKQPEQTGKPGDDAERDAAGERKSVKRMDPQEAGGVCGADRRGPRDD